MESATVLQLLLLTCVASASEQYNRLMTTPQNAEVEIGTHLKATCVIINSTEVTADDLYWTLGSATVPSEQYTKINESALNVTVLVMGEDNEWLVCKSKKASPYVFLNPGKFMHGILLQKGYLPRKPENLSCVALQGHRVISPNITCVWDPVDRGTKSIHTRLTLNVRNIILNHTSTAEVKGNRATVSMDIFPHHLELEIWVEARNSLGRVESEHLKKLADSFVKPNPPSEISVLSEKTFPTSLLIKWSHSLPEQYMRQKTHQIRYCGHRSQNWTYVSSTDTAKDIQSFRLQNLQPDTLYDTQVRCRNSAVDGYWSDWSANATKKTPEAPPKGKPDLWKITMEDESINKRQVQFVCKDPVLSNGRIIRFDIEIQKDAVRNDSWESVPVSRTEADLSSGQQTITPLKKVQLEDKEVVHAYVTASNSVGTSDEASLVIPIKANELAPVETLEVRPEGEQLHLEWKPPKRRPVSEYVVEWVSFNQTDWQRESRHTRHTVIKGKLEKCVLYTVSVYPIYQGWIGRAASKEAYVVEGAPTKGPEVRLSSKPGRNEATVEWREIPLQDRRGFITNYTIHYYSETEVHKITVPANTTSYTLTKLLGNTKYDISVMVSTIAGSKKGSNHSFTTLKYAPGEVEGIVVGVSLGFLFVVVLTMLLCIYKKDVIKENFWPQIPNPGESTIGNWSPDYPLKAETPKETCQTGFSVLDVDVCDGKCVFEEDKASLSLKKGKYLSEEHSSGIGGSSCMSSPRQSVSDSDEGGDMADTTASTVQYSSVVASNGYKGQTPSSQPQQAIFSRSESTQPLLDSEENPDILVQEGSRQSQRFPRQPCFMHRMGNKDATDPVDFNQLEMEQQGALEPLDFCSLEEDSEQPTPTDGQSADRLPTVPVSSYMPQLGGYRPQ